MNVIAEFARRLGATLRTEGRDVSALLESLGVEMARHDEDSIRIEDEPIEFPKAAFPNDKTMAHYLGHLVLHMRFFQDAPIVQKFSHLPLVDDATVEKEADVFAEHLIEGFKGGRSVVPFHDISEAWNDVPSAFVLRDLKVKEALTYFCSYDLVGSTALKSASRSHWPKIVATFFQACRREIVEGSSLGFESWKNLGDEALFFCKTRESELPELISYTADALERIRDGLRSWDHLVDVKATAWACKVAVLEDGQDDDESAVDSADWQTQASPPDFLGQNIDLGFRIAKFARKGTVTLSPALVSFARRKHGLLFVGMHALQGVANGVPVPVVWMGSRKCFDPIDLHEDELIRSACDGDITSDRRKIDEATSAFRRRAQKYGYFFPSESPIKRVTKTRRKTRRSRSS